jgi:hypothetical protein
MQAVIVPTLRFPWDFFIKVHGYLHKYSKNILKLASHFTFGKLEIRAF